MCAAGCRPSIMGKIFLKRARSNNYENFAYGILVRDSGLAGGWRPDDYTTLPLACQVVILHKKNLHFLCRFYRVALVRSHFKPSCVLRTIYIAGGRSLCTGSVLHFQFTVLLSQLVTSQPRPICEVFS